MTNVETIENIIAHCDFLRSDLTALYREADDRAMMIVAEMMLAKVAFIEQKMKFLHPGRLPL